MIRFTATTAFAFIRQIAVIGLTEPSIYLLICEAGEAERVKDELSAEMKVQLASELQILDASSTTFKKLLEAIAANDGTGIVLVDFHRWDKTLTESIDRNVVSLTTGGPVILLAGFDVTERLLRAAPNLRSRLADVLSIKPDPALRVNGDGARRRVH
jgi:hypothetical protein